MPAFIVATVMVHDAAKFAVYLGHVKGLWTRFGGTPVLSGPVVETVEGPATPQGEKVTVLTFPDEAAARAYLASPEYQAGKAAREGAADLTIRLVVT